ncbi:polysaccharide deacetylase family protein [Planococcus sp. SE5232]|uniref:polysaccharide deacetylase family protein n=1 Tax=unclassified Planococcus (in: firmicutes) TaxID=2662419 RepID=UPI003D6A1EFC
MAINLNREGVALNAEERNKRNQNWTAIEQEVAGIGSNIADLDEISSGAVGEINTLKTETAKQKEGLTAVNTRVDNVVIEAGEAAFDKVIDASKLEWQEPVATFADLATTYPDATEAFTSQTTSDGSVYRFNGSEWKKIQQVDAGPINEVDTRLTAQLAETGSQIGGVNIDKLKDNTSSNSLLQMSAKKPKQPLVTFIDDDGKSEVWTRLKPIFESRGVPCTLAIVSDWVGTTGNMTQQQILSLQNDLGWEMASHEKTHMAMGNVLDDATIEREIVQSKKELLEMGMNVTNIVYPFGQSNPTMLAKVAEYYNMGVTTNSGTLPQTNKAPLNRTYLFRTALGSFAGEANTLAHYKAAIDKAIAENSWLIFMTHVAQHDLTQDDYLAQTIDYAIEKSVKVVNFRDGLEYFGDRMDIEGLMKVDVDGKFTSDKFVVGVRDRLIDTNTKANDISFIKANYSQHHILYTSFSFANSSGMPGNTAGLLKTNLERSEVGYITQEYRLYNTGEVFKRTYTDANTWTMWESADSWKLIKRPTRKAVVVPDLVFAPNETKVIDIDLSGMGALLTRTPIIATCRSFQVDGFSYNIRVASATTGKLRLTNLSSTSVTFFAIDWDFTIVWE